MPAAGDVADDAANGIADVVDRPADLLTRYPLFAGDRAEDLSQYLSNRLAGGDGASVLTTVLESKYQASKRLLDHTAAMIKGQRVFVLLDEQLVVGLQGAYAPDYGGPRRIVRQYSVNSAQVSG